MKLAVASSYVALCILGLADLRVAEASPIQGLSGGSKGPWSEADSFSGSWTILPPPSGFEHSTVYDSKRNRLVVFRKTGTGSDTWVLPLDGNPHWEQLIIPGAGPSPREGNVAIYDPVGDRMLIFGGE